VAADSGSGWQLAVAVAVAGVAVGDGLSNGAKMSENGWDLTEIMAVAVGGGGVAVTAGSDSGRGWQWLGWQWMGVAVAFEWC
jgi:hypothetical protein